MSDKKIYLRSLQKSFRLFIALVVLLPAASAMAQGEAVIRWELVNPFRFISDRNSMDELRSVYEGLSLSERTAYGLERKLQKLSEEAVDKRRAKARERFDCDHTKSEEELKQCFEPYLGWFETLARDNYSKTCWDAAARKFRNYLDCANYIYPTSHKVRVWIENEQSLGVRVPEWFINDGPLPKYSEYERCDAKYRKAFCVEFPVPYNVDKPETINVSARFPDGGSKIGPLPVTVVDKLIVGLGDSYAAGEGNPDIPARFTLQKKDPDFFKKFLLGASQALKSRFKYTQEPRKDDYKGAEVGWLDNRCHRSMYSYQFQTALRLALSNPQEAITYVSYSCSGATTDQIINEREGSKEGGGHVQPQLEALRKVLANETGNPREIDYLLLSTGGNDIGFADFIAYVVTGGWTRRLVAFGINEGSLEKGAVKIATTLMGNGDKKGNYFKLKEALLDKPYGIRIKGCGDNKPCAKRILLTPYPDIFRDENGNPCKADRKEFDNPFGPDDKREARINLLLKYIFPPLNDLQLRRVPAELGWTVVTDRNMARYSSHGFCARNALSASKTGEKFEMPKCEPKDRCKKGEWTSFQPREYRAYETRQRWLRLPVDAKLTTDQVHIFANRFRVDLALEDDRSNIMHPTSEGLATHADANFNTIQMLEEQFK
ncbi:MAG: hypothetical protein ICV60_00465 [Pyrinomonadaceae bacterium]|nr:hypothetical protein [Pyrinomonadaceae bacterium]